jgi:hypothetical protein
MGEPQQPFIGSEALRSGSLNRYELRTYYRAIMPNVYLDKRVRPSLRQRTLAAYLWSRRDAVVSGLAASAIHGTKWIDDDSPVELIWNNARSPNGVVTRDQLLLDNEIQRLDGLPVTTPERTAFDLGHLEKVLDLVDAGAESPKETWLRLLLIRVGFPRPQTQIPVLSPDGCRWYYLDMGWEDIKLAAEYDGDHHRSDPVVFAYDIRRLDDLRELGWTIIRVAARHRSDDVVSRVRRAWDAESTKVS